MTAPPPRTPAECFASMLLSMKTAVEAPSLRGRLARPLALLILNLIRRLHQLFTELAAQIAAGTDVARHCGAAHRSKAAAPLPDVSAVRDKLAPALAGDAAQLKRRFPDPEIGRMPPPALQQDRSGPAAENPSLAMREREGPVAQRREGEGLHAAKPPPEAASPPVPEARACGPPLPLPA